MAIPVDSERERESEFFKNLSMYDRRRMWRMENLNSI